MLSICQVSLHLVPFNTPVCSQHMPNFRILTDHMLQLCRYCNIGLLGLSSPSREVFLVYSAVSLPWSSPYGVGEHTSIITQFSMFSFVLSFAEPNLS